MKKTIVLFIMLSLMFSANIIVNDVVANTNPTQKDTLFLNTTSDLHYLVNKWANEYTQGHPDINIKVISFEEGLIPKTIFTGTEIGFVSKLSFNSLNAASFWKLVVGRDVVVPVINTNNPFQDQITAQGISPRAMSQLFESPTKREWGTLLGNDQNTPVNFYSIDDQSINSEASTFLNVNETAINGTVVENSEELISAIQNDPYAIGFCKLTNIIESNNQNFVKNIKPMPIDRNGNGKIDYHENIYKDVCTLSRAIWIGKYPKSLSSNIYSVSSEKPSGELEINFLKWVNSEGQQFLNDNGYVDLVLSERHSNLEKLNEHKIFIEDSSDKYASQKLILLIIIGALVLGFIINGIARYRKNKKASALGIASATASILNENSVSIPKGLYFDKSHTWAFMEKDGRVKVGIDDFLQHATGPITRTIMKNPGDRIKKGEQLITLVQDGKQLNIYAPISGVISDTNEILVAESSMINSSPYTEGWIYMIEPSNWMREIQFLKMAGNYKEWLINEFSRLKDFIVYSANANKVGYAQVALQDGGELKDNVLQDFGPELWEDFQKHFIDTSQLR